jgi:serine/threonine protein kinase
MSTPVSQARVTPEQITPVLQSMGYDLMKEIGEGASARCFLVFSRQYQTLFVAKAMSLLCRQICSECEVNALRQLTSPYVISLYDVAFRPDCLYLVLEYCPLGPLDDYVRSNGPFSGAQLYGMCKAILTGLAYIHSQRFAHLDLKPSNILLDRYGRTKLADFGIARLFRLRAVTEQRAGSLAFMAPDVYSARSYDPFKADIWSLGVTFFFLAIGKVPWVSELPTQLQKEISTGCFTVPSSLDGPFAHVLREMMNVDARQRPSAADLLKMSPFAEADVKQGFVQVKTATKAPVAAAPGIRRPATAVMRKPAPIKPAAACPVPPP